jgi:CIC family chloride channel protein
VSKPRPLEVFLLRLSHLLRLDEDRRFLIVALLTGAAAGLTAILYHVLLGTIYTFCFGEVDFSRHDDWHIVFWPLLGGLIASVILMKLPQARGSGVAHTKIAIFVRDGYIPLRSTIGKFLASAIGIGSGQSMGPEGPALHIGAGIASLAGRLATLSKQRMQQLVPVGAAAGLAAVFNAPITAVLFIIEEIVGNVNTPVLGSTVIAAVIAVIVAHWIVGPEALFQIPAYSVVGGSELLIFAVLGVVGGLASVAFTRGLEKGRDRLLRVPTRFAVWLPAAGGLAVGIMGLAYPQILSVGYNYVSDVLNNRLTLALMIALAMFKILGTMVCYATGNAGGIFAPSLYMGAMVGGATGEIAHILFPASRLSDVGAYALIGMGAMFAGNNRTPITSIFMIFEVTRDYNMMLPVMIANVIAYAVAMKLQPDGIYEILAAQDGVHLPTHRTRHTLRQLTNSDALVTDYLGFDEHEPVKVVAREIAGSNQTGFPVFEGGRFVGLITNDQVTRAVAEGRDLTAGELAAWRPDLMVFPDESLEGSLQLLGHGAAVLPVVSRLNTHTLLGLVTTTDVMRAFGVAQTGRVETPPEQKVETKL